MSRWWKIAAAVGIIAVLRVLSNQFGYGWDKDAALNFLKKWSERLGIWAIPLYVATHTLSIALCLPPAIFLEAAASLLFGFLQAVLCVFTAKLLGASLSFWIGRLVFTSSSSAMEWAQRNKYFHLLSKGVERDGWRFVLLARFSPLPSYVINYTLAATKVRFFVDFLLPTIIGCIPMILQNISLGSLAGAAVATASGSKKSEFWSFLFPILGILSSVIISLKIKKYSTSVSADETSSGRDNLVDSSQTLTGSEQRESLKKEE